MEEKITIASYDKLYQDINYHLINDTTPSEYLNMISKESTFKGYPFSMLLELQETKQSPIHHPEGNAWNHTLLVVDEAAKRKSLSIDASSFMWAALLHDIGKPSTTKNRKGKITSYDHDKVGEKLSIDFLSTFTEDTIFIHHVSSLVRYHMHILYILKDLPFADIEGMKEKVNIKELGLLGLCDRLGRTHSDFKEEEKNMQAFIRKCNSF